MIAFPHPHLLLELLVEEVVVLLLEVVQLHHRRARPHLQCPDSGRCLPDSMSCSMALESS